MKSSTFVSAIALVSAVFSVAASAQTGRPSAAEVQDRSAPAQVASTDSEVGSYARYLMLNGVTRDEAIAAARNTDHPATRVVAARSVRGGVGAKASAQQ